MREIVKVQISQNDGGASILVYNEDRSIFQQMPSTPAMKRAVGPSGKRYFSISRIQDEIILEDIAPEQDW